MLLNDLTANADPNPPVASGGQLGVGRCPSAGQRTDLHEQVSCQEGRRKGPFPAWGKGFKSIACELQRCQRAKCRSLRVVRLPRPIVQAEAEG